MTSPLLSPAFLALSARLGKDPLQVQGAGGNTSVKDEAGMWIKASGTHLADALSGSIFVEVALADIRPERGETAPGASSAMQGGLRPSIETSFHAMLGWIYVIHTHSIATLVHAISPQGRSCLAAKLAGLPYVEVPYRQPGPDLTRAILERREAGTQIFILHNHGLICCADSIDEVTTLIDAVERRLSMPARTMAWSLPERRPRSGYAWSRHSWLAQDEATTSRLLSGSYYPDHVVFLGPALPMDTSPGTPPVLIAPGEGILIHDDATPAEIAMLDCLADLMVRLPPDWTTESLGAAAEAALLDWDAEKYRQTMASRQ